MLLTSGSRDTVRLQRAIGASRTKSRRNRGATQIHHHHKGAGDEVQSTASAAWGAHATSVWPQLRQGGDRAKGEPAKRSAAPWLALRPRMRRSPSAVGGRCRSSAVVGRRRPTVVLGRWLSTVAGRRSSSLVGSLVVGHRRPSAVSNRSSAVVGRPRPWEGRWPSSVVLGPGSSALVAFSTLTRHNASVVPGETHAGA